MTAKTTAKLYRFPTSKTWYALVYIGGGYRIKRYVPLDTEDMGEAQSRFEVFKKDALQDFVEAIVQEKLLSEEQPLASQHRIDTLVDWCLYRYMPSRSRSDKTVKNKEPILRRFLAYCRTRNVGTMQQLSTRIVDDWQEHEKQLMHTRAPRRRDELSCIKTFVETACERNDIDPPRISWDLPPKMRGGGQPSVELKTLHAFLAAAKEMHAIDAYDIAAWTALTTFRPGDFEVFEWKHDLGDSIKFPRAKKRGDRAAVVMDVPVNPAMREILDRRKAMHGDTGRVFKRAGKGTPYTSNGVTKLFEDFSKRCGIEGVTPTGIRKTFATHCAQVARSPKTLQKLMAHSDVSMSLSYYAEATDGATIAASDEMAKLMLGPQKR